MQKRWKILEADEARVMELHKALGVSLLLSKLLVQRGYDTFDKAKYFFRPQLIILLPRPQHIIECGMNHLYIFRRN